MTALAGHKLQEAVFSLLTLSQSLALKVAGIFDQPPADASYPYIEFGEMSASRSALKDRSADAITFAVIVWSDEQSQMQVKELMADVDSVLSGQVLSIVGLDSLGLRLTSANVVRQFTDRRALYKGQLMYSAQLYEQT